MLIRFKVSNFKQFKNLALDFTEVRDYKFSKDCLSVNGHRSLVRNALIFAENGAGKTNLGYAIFDITQHLVDKQTQQEAYLFYLNADNPKTPATFEYTFLLGDYEIVYTYQKLSAKEIISEAFYVDGQLIFSWEPTNHESNLVGLKILGLENLNWSYKDRAISLLRYIANNTKLKKNSPVKLVMDFVSDMLWFRRVDKNNNFIGFMPVSEDINTYILKEGLVKDYEKFLQANGVNEKITQIPTLTGSQVLAFKHKLPLPLFDTASSGTTALTLQYYWLKQMSRVSFVFMDEFDAFYHFEVAENIFKIVKKIKALQSVFTTHNTMLLDSCLTRPDCCYKMKDGTIASFANMTSREIREGNNLAKLYIGGEFDGR